MDDVIRLRDSFNRESKDSRKSVPSVQSSVPSMQSSVPRVANLGQIYTSSTCRETDNCSTLSAASVRLKVAKRLRHL